MSAVFGSQNKPNLFASLNTNNSQTQQSGPGLFSSSQAQNSGLGQSASLFAQPQPQQQQNNNNTQSSGLFGVNNQQQNTQSSSLFGGNIQQQTSGLFNSTTQAQQQQPQQQSSLSGTSLGASQQPSLIQGRSSTIWQPENTLRPREKTVPEQMQTLLEKWSPESQNCIFQKYFYNSVDEQKVPMYGPEPGEDEQKWEDALAKKPSKNSIPVLCRGFAELGNRLRIQIQAVQVLQATLHTIDGSLHAQQEQHELDVSVRVMEARRRHIALSQRCLKLATQTQVARNRGYSLDGSEEALKRRLKELEDKAMDGSLNSKSEGIWARMLTIREKVRALTEDTAKTGEGHRQSGEADIDEEILQKTKKILGDYDSQISHLHREIREIRKDFEEWGSGR